MTDIVIESGSYRCYARVSSSFWFSSRRGQRSIVIGSAGLVVGVDLFRRPQNQDTLRLYIYNILLFPYSLALCKVKICRERYIRDSSENSVNTGTIIEHF